MVYTGKNIQSTSDSLMKITEDYLYHSICNPEPEILGLIKQLRVVRQLDEVKYRNLKKQLPYVVCANFNPPHCHGDNFCYIESFFLDIDHIQEKGYDMKALRDKLCKDEHVVMVFASPSGDGLKVLFHLEERCHDSGLYKLFYKTFSERKAVEWEVTQVVDSKTCDATRACFISADENAYFNPEATSIRFDDYIDTSNTASLFELKHEIEYLPPVEIEPEEQRPIDPDSDVLGKIKNTLALKKQKIQEDTEVYVPEQLEEMLPSLSSYIESFGIHIDNVRNIQYAKKIQLSLGHKKAEINLFYGRRGFSVVPSPKSGTSEELNSIAADLIDAYIVENF